MTRMHSRSKLAELKTELEAGGGAVRDLVRGVLQTILEKEMTGALGAAKSEQASGRLLPFELLQAFLTTRVGQIDYVRQDRNGVFSTDLFERYERSEKPLASGSGQLRDPQAFEDPRIARQTIPVPPPLRADLRLVAQPNGVPARHQAGLVRQRSAPCPDH